MYKTKAWLVADEMEWQPKNDRTEIEILDSGNNDVNTGLVTKDGQRIYRVRDRAAFVRNDGE